MIAKDQGTTPSSLIRRSALPFAGTAVVLAILLAGGGAPSSAARHSRESGIRVGVGIAGVRIGMTRSQVRHVLGRPRRVEVQKHSALGPGHPTRFYYRGLGVEFWKGAPRTPSGSKPPDRKLRVAAVNTTRRAPRTRRGIGVGSTEGQVRRKVPAARCETLALDPSSNRGPRFRVCHIGRYDCKPPHWALGDLPCHVTAFVLNRKHGHVVRVSIGWLGAPNGKF